MDQAEPTSKEGLESHVSNVDRPRSNARLPTMGKYLVNDARDMTRTASLRNIEGEGSLVEEIFQRSSLLLPRTVAPLAPAPLLLELPVGLHPQRRPVVAMSSCNSSSSSHIIIIITTTSNSPLGSAVRLLEILISRGVYGLPAR